MVALRLTPVGDAVGVVLPPEVLARLKLAVGGSVFLTDLPNGLLLTPEEIGLDEQVAAGRELMRQYRDTFQRLAE